MGTGLQRLLAAGACGLAATVLMPITASAHAFLVQTSPAAGQRLLMSPPAITLEFSEAVAPAGIQVSIQASGGQPVRTPSPARSPDAEHVRLPLPALPPGVYKVQWEVVSADDGHLSAGSFVFAVGTSAGLPPETGTTTEPTDWQQSAARFLFLIGLALAAGMLVDATWVWKPAGLALPPGSGLSLGVPLAVATLAAGTRFALFVWRLRPAGASIFTRAAWESALQSPAGLYDLVAVLLLLISGGLVLWRARQIVLLPLALAAVSAAITTHPASARGWWGLPAIMVHVLLTLLWFGMLAHVVLVIGLRRAELARTAVIVAVRRYARLAFWSVAGVLVTGLLAALAEFSAPAQLVSTSYGKVLLVKVAIVTLALLAAAAMRLRALGAASAERVITIRRLSLVEGVLLVGVVAISSVLSAVAPPSFPSSALAANPELGPPVPNGPAVYLAGQAGWFEVYLVASDGQLAITASGPESTSPSDLRLSLKRGVSGGSWSIIQAAPCGPGCLTAPFKWMERTTDLEIGVASARWPGGTVHFTVPWPPVAGDRQLLASVIRTMQRQPKVTLDEHVTSGPGAMAHNVVTIAGSTFLANEPYGVDTGQLEALPDRDGLKVLVVYLPGSQIWVQLSSDADHRLRAETIVDPGHLIERTLSYP